MAGSALPHIGQVPGLGVLWVRRVILQGIYSKTFPGEIQAWGPCGKGVPAPAETVTSCGRRAQELWASFGGSAALPAVRLDVSGSHPD